MDIFTRIFNEIPDIPLKEVLRYAGLKEENEDVKRCIAEAFKVISPKACYVRLPAGVSESTVDFGEFSVVSNKLSINLEGCKEAYLFCATLGSGIDMLINRYSSVSPVKALYFQAIGAAAIESVCDFLCKKVFPADKDEKLRPRFSPGYGDFELKHQETIFSVLDCRRKIGVYLTKGGLMVPSKSVTAVAGIGNISENCKSGCEACSLKEECEFKKEG